MKKLKQLSRREMRSVSGAKKLQDPNGSGGECGCVAAFCVTDSNKDGSKYCSDTKCC